MKTHSIALVLAATLQVATSCAFSSETANFACGGHKPNESALDAGPSDLRKAIAADLRANDFKSVVDTAEAWRAADCRLRDGRTQLTFWLSGFTTYFQSLQDWTAGLELVGRLNAAYPDHPLARLAEARYWSDYANNARGFGSAQTVTPEAWRLFRERLLKSEAILVSVAETASTWPHWYWQMIRVQSMLERPLASRVRIFADGIKRFPREIAISDEMSYYLEPRWGGNWSQVDEVITLAAQSAGAGEADLVYATLYRGRGDLLPQGQDFFAETHASWQRMRSGFAGLLQRYPNSTFLTNSLLSYACLASDKATYLEHRKSAVSHDRRAWTRGRTRSSCDTQFGYAG